VQEHADYRTLDERLAEWRTEILTRMDRLDELPVLPTFPRVNLAREAGTTVRVDSFLGTANAHAVGDVYYDLQAPGATALPFASEDPDHPVLAELRQRFPLEEVAGDGTDVEKAIRLRDWIKSLFPHHIPYRMPEWNALLILDRGSRGVEHFICVHYSVSLVQCCLALGLPARMINLHRGLSDHYRIGDEAVADPPVDEHVVAEVWSSDLDKWVMMDTDFDVHYQRDGVPLSAWEIHEAFAADELAKIEPQRGPHSLSFNAYGEKLPDEDDFFATGLPAYYAHVTVLMRNDFLSDTDGPVTMAHLVDDTATPLLWHRGSDNRLQPHLMGPVVVAQPYTDVTPVLTDGNRRTSWASSDSSAAHTVEIALAGPRLLGRAVLHWPEYLLSYHSSATYRLDTRDGDDGAWEPWVEVTSGPETPYSVHDASARRATHVRLVQPAGGGSAAFPERLWLTQVELYAP
jgi:hypothetical protein